MKKQIFSLIMLAVIAGCQDQHVTYGRVISKILHGVDTMKIVTLGRDTVVLTDLPAQEFLNLSIGDSVEIGRNGFTAMRFVKKVK